MVAFLAGAQSNPEGTSSQALPADDESWWPVISLMLGFVIGGRVVQRRAMSLRDAAPSSWRLSPMVSLAIFAGMLLGGAIGAALACRIAGVGQDSQTLQASVIAGIGGFVAQMVAAAAIGWGVPCAEKPINAHQLVAQSGAGSPAKRSLIQCAALGVAAIAIAWFPLQSIGSIVASIQDGLGGTAPPRIGHNALDLIGTSTDAWLRYGMYAIALVCAPISEELLFRGAAQQALIGMGLSRWRSILIASAGFAIVHAGILSEGALASGLATLFALSCVLGWLTERTGNLIASMVGHSAFNAMNLAIFIWG